MYRTEVHGGAGYNFVLLGDEAGKQQSPHGSKEPFMGELALIPPALGSSKTLLNRDHHEAYFAGGCAVAGTRRSNLAPLQVCMLHWQRTLSACRACCDHHKASFVAGCPAAGMASASVWLVCRRCVGSTA